MIETTKLIRRNIHTYPFKYTYNTAESFFRADTAALYLHIPFCTKKCHFCDYVVYTNTADELREEYVRALCREVASFIANPVFPRYAVEAIYFGGGTPGLLDAPQLRRILEACQQTFDVLPGAEIAIEFDPQCVDEPKLRDLRDAGFNRLSVGAQSFDDTILRNTNRPHDAAGIDRAMATVHAVGFTHTNIDLIYPLGGLTLPLWEQSVDRAIALEPACITAYPLEVWPKTAYHDWLQKKRLEIPSAELEAKMAEVAFDRLEAAGYRRLSTSGYYHPSRARTYCRFLDYYWRTWPMLGFGVSSKSVVNDRLYTNLRPIGEYIRRVQNGQPVLDFSTRMTKRQEMHRVMIRGLKMCEVSKPDFFARFGVEMDVIFRAEIGGLVAKGLVVDTRERVYLTRAGQVFSSNVYEAFYTDDDLRAPRTGEVQFGISELVREN